MIIDFKLLVAATYITVYSNQQINPQIKYPITYQEPKLDQEKIGKERRRNKKKKKENFREENQPNGKSLIKDITIIIPLNPELTFFSSPFHRLKPNNYFIQKSA
jgi:hypothetical protein